MDFVQVAADKRDTALKPKQLRSNSLLPAEFYGGGKKNLSLQMDYQSFRHAYQKSGESTVIELTVEGQKEPLTVLVHQIQYDPATGKMMHVDFINVRMDQEVHTNIPLEFVGVSPAVKDLSGMLMTNISELEVKCLPKYLVHSIEVDISGLEDFNAVIHVSDLIIPENIEVVTDPERSVVTVMAPREEEEEPETEEEGVEGEEGEEGEEGAEGEEGSEEKKEEGSEEKSD